MKTGTGWRPEQITPRTERVDADVEGLVDVLGDAAALARRLASSKALVLRGFGVTPESLEKVLPLLLPDRLAYVYGNSPRTKVGANVYTSTEYPPEYTISMHSEMSYAARWPARLLFFCERAPETGGATPVVDTAGWYQALDPEVRKAFAGGVRYTQNLHGGRGLGKSWQDTFETSDREQVEEYLDGMGASWWWKPYGGLRITHTRPAVLEDDGGTTPLWFNQADQWHPSALEGEAAALLEALPEEDLPQSVTFADGSPIPSAYVRQVRDRGLQCAVDVDWRVGDLMLIDNVRTAHGRRPFTGSRRVLVAMSD